MSHRLTATPQPIFSPRPAPELTRPIAPITAPEAAPDQRSAAPLAPPPDRVDVQSLGALAQGGRWRTAAMRAHRRPALYWITRGQGRATIAGTTRGFGPNTAFLLPPGVMHGLDLLGQVAGWRVLLPAGAVLDWPDTPCRLCLRDGRRQLELTALIDALRAEVEAERPHREAALIHEAGRLAVWLARAADDRETEPAASRYGRIAARYADLIESHFADGRGVAAYAERLGVSATHLARVCREVSGRSAHDLLIDRRLYEARRLLAQGEASVGGIARATGFTTAAYFARAFRAHTGLSPSAFRATARGQAPSSPLAQF